MGGEPTRDSRRYLRQKMTQAGIDTTHLKDRRVRHTEEALREAVAKSHSVKDVVRHLGISNVGGNQTHISRRILGLGIDTSHFARPQAWPKGALGSLLTLRSPADGRAPGRRLRRELLRLGIPERCADCGGTDWHGDPLPLEVDHINGDWWDNRQDNLRYLCPNCHALTATWSRGGGRTPVPPDSAVH